VPAPVAPVVPAVAVEPDADEPVLDADALGLVVALASMYLPVRPDAAVVDVVDPEVLDAVPAIPELASCTHPVTVTVLSAPLRVCVLGVCVLGFCAAPTMQLALMANAIAVHVSRFICIGLLAVGFCKRETTTRRDGLFDPARIENPCVTVVLGGFSLSGIESSSTSRVLRATPVRSPASKLATALVVVTGTAEARDPEPI